MVLQRYHRCVNSSEVFDKWVVNKKDFLSFDPLTLTWTTISDQAAPLVVEWSKLNTRNCIYRDFGLGLCKTAYNLTQAAQMSEVAQTGKQSEQ